MADDSPDEQRKRTFAEAMKRYRDREVPTIFADGVLGTAHSNGVERITLLQEVFNPDPDATESSFQPVAVLCVPSSQLLNFAHGIIEAHQALAAQREAANATKQ